MKFLKMLERNVPASVEEDSIIFTEKGDMYVSKNDGTLVAVGGNGEGGGVIVEAVTSALFPAVGASDTLYIDTTANLMYRWSGTIYVPMGASTAIGEVAGTAYPGEKGVILATALNGHLADMDIHTTPEEKAKLDGISTGANKVESSATNGNIKIDGVERVVYTHPTGTNPHGTTKSDVGLGNVDNTSDLDKPVSTAAQSALNLKINTSQKGVANGIAQLDDNGIIPSSQLPSYVDDVLEYTSNSLFPTIGESGKIYLNTTNNLTYRWTGSGYAEISPSIALGETSSTAYSGDKGKATTDKVNGHLADTISHITSTERTNWNRASTNNHIHSNKTILDNTTASYTTDEKTKLSGIATGANNYVHPVNHAPSIITQDVNNRFVTDVEKATWNEKATQATIDASIKNVVIGGRNYARYSGGTYLDKAGIHLGDRARASITNVDGKTCLQILNNASTPHIRFLQIPIPEKEVYTFSIWIKGTTNHSAKIFQWATTYYDTRTFNVTDSWAKYSFTFTAYSPTDTVHLLNFPETTYISDWKFEKGTKATDWSPAPEDIDSAIALKADKVTSGTTATRPIPTHIGQVHFDTTLGKPIWCKSINPIIWVDSTGTVV